MHILDAKIICNKKIAKDSCLLVLESEEISKSSRPGQFLMLGVCAPMANILKRPFSICLSYPEKSQISILYAIRGSVTSYISLLKPADKLSIIGPLGNGFDIPTDTSRLILLGGGIGIAPLISLLPYYGSRSVFIAGFKSKEKLIDPKDIFPEDYDCLLATEDGSFGYKGTAVDIFKQYIKDKTLSHSIVISCGPISMLKQVAEICIKRRLDCYVSLETYMACGTGLCQGCVVKTKTGYKRVCKEGPVFKAEELCWNKLPI